MRVKTWIEYGEMTGPPVCATRTRYVPAGRAPAAQCTGANPGIVVALATTDPAPFRISASTCAAFVERANATSAMSDVTSAGNVTENQSSLSGLSVSPVRSQPGAGLIVASPASSSGSFASSATKPSAM